MKNINQNTDDNKAIEKLILEQSTHFVSPKGKGNELIWKNISNTISEKSTTKINNKNTKHIIYKIAASIVFIVLSSIAYLYSDSNYSTNYAETSTIDLPDGSTVLLYADSRILLNKKLWDTNRELTLNGEAYFTVKKGSDFTVNTENGIVKVLGTKFNVTSRKENFNVSCVSGKVRVQLNNNEKVILTKGFCTKKLKTGHLIKPIKKDINITLKRNNGEFYFEESSLLLVFEEFERQFNVQIEYTKTENRKFTGYFSNNDIETALKIICKPMKLNYEIDNKLIFIKDLAKSNK